MPPNYLLATPPADKTHFSFTTHTSKTSGWPAPSESGIQEDHYNTTRAPATAITKNSVMSGALTALDFTAFEGLVLVVCDVDTAVERATAGSAELAATDAAEAALVVVTTGSSEAVEFAVTISAATGSARERQGSRLNT
jgi:hypothetical protein